MQSNTSRKFRVQVPLHNFNWEGNEFKVSNFGTIQRLQSPPQLLWSRDFISKYEMDKLASVSHWLYFEQKDSDKLKSAEKCNIFLFVLWISIPTKIQIKFRFKETYQNAEAMERKVSRYLNRFQWIKEQAQTIIKTENLKEASIYFDSAREIYSNQKRLYNSMVLTFAGCTTDQWQVAFICFASAVEGLLTYSRGPRITNKLATSFACLTEAEKSKRDIAFSAFKKSYGIRSDIMHGRAYNLNRPEENRKELAKFSDLLRKLWQIVLSDKSIINILEEEDDIRRSWFNNLETGYQPPVP